MNDIVLKPCPFCGGEAIIRMSTNGQPYITAIHDKKCIVTPDTFLVSLHKPLKKQIKAWNTRAEA